MIYVRILTLLLGCGLSGWLGFRLADGLAAKRELVVATAYADWGQSAIEAVREQLEAESKRAILTAELRGRKTALSQEVIREAAQDVDRSCEWRPAHRLRIESLYSVYGLSAKAGTPGMRFDLSGTTQPRSSQRAMGIGNSFLGLGLQETAR